MPATGCLLPIEAGGLEERFGGRDGEFSFELKVPVVHPDGEVECPPPHLAPHRPKLCWWRMESLSVGWGPGGACRERKSWALRKAVLTPLVKEGRVASSLGAVQPLGPEDCWRLSRGQRLGGLRDSVCLHVYVCSC